MPTNFVIGDKVSCNSYWSGDFSEDNPGTIEAKNWIESEQYWSYDVSYESGGGSKQLGKGYEACNLILIGGTRPIFEAEIISSGAGRALYTFRADDLNKAKAHVEALGSGTEQDPLGRTLLQLMDCASPADGWKDRVIVTYIKEVAR